MVWLFSFLACFVWWLDCLVVWAVVFARCGDFIVGCVFIAYCDALIVLVSLCSSGILCVFVAYCLLCC